MQKWSAEADFTHHAHTATVSAVAASERFVVTGSKDETIQLYDMKKRTDHGALLHHSGERHQFMSGFLLFHNDSCDLYD